MNRTIVVAASAVVVEPLLTGVGVLVRDLAACAGTACSGRGAVPVAASGDAALTALAVAAPYLLAMLGAAAVALVPAATRRD